MCGTESRVEGSDASSEVCMYLYKILEITDREVIRTLALAEVVT